MSSSPQPDGGIISSYGPGSRGETSGGSARLNQRPCYIRTRCNTPSAELVKRPHRQGVLTPLFGHFIDLVFLPPAARKTLPALKNQSGTTLRHKRQGGVRTHDPPLKAPSPPRGVRAGKRGLTSGLCRHWMPGWTE